jgi:hypothetical protein
VVSGIVGAGMGAMFRNGDQGKKAQADQFKKLAEIQKAKEAAAQAARSQPVEQPPVYQVTPEGQAFVPDPTIELARQHAAELQAEAIKAKQQEQAGPRAFDDMVNSQIGGWNEPVRQRVDPMDQVRDQLERQVRTNVGAEADAVLARRQQDMQDQVARQTSLDFNAAERARRENASTGYPGWLEENGPIPAEAPPPHVVERQQREQGIKRSAEEEAAWSQRTQEVEAEQKAQAAKDQAEAAREPLLNDLEQSLRQSAYTPDLQGQGPKTRAAKAEMNRGMRLSLIHISEPTRPCH